MLVVHAHWKPPSSPSETGGMLFWVETAAADAPAWQRGRLSQKPRSKEHPFCAPPAAIQAIISARGEERPLTLRLPTTRSGPQPSPLLAHNWELDLETKPFLAPWVIRGLWLDTVEALQALVNLPDRAENRAEDQGPFALASDALYWRRVTALALEALVAQKIVPVPAPADAAGRVFHARWLPVLDRPKDGPRLAQLEAALPPVCRSELVDNNPPPSPRALLNTFLNTACDALARRWARNAWRSAASSLQFISSREEPGSRWLEALCREDPSVEASPAQLQALEASQRAWMRNLHVAGDAAFRIAFRLEAPRLPKNGDPEPAQPKWRLHYLLQARDDPSLLIPAEAVWKTRGNVLKQLQRRFEQPQEKLLAGLGYAARLFSPIASSLQSKHPTQQTLDSQGVYTFMREAAPVLEEAGFGLLVPPWWNKPGTRLGVRLRMKPAKGPSAEAIARSKMSLENLVNYEWELALGDTTLTEEEFHALAALKSPLVQIRGQWVQLDPEQIEAAIQFWEKQQLHGQMGLLEALQFGLGVHTNESGLPIDHVTQEGWLSEWFERLSEYEKLTELPQPGGLQGELRPYQRFGYSWLHFHRRWGLGACLADDMGLGKTLQTIALLLREKETLGSLPAPTLLICPTSVVTNWEREIRRFAPALTTLIHQGANRLRGEDFVQAARSVDMVLTSYALARLDVESMQMVSWFGVVLDEAQNIKNPSAKQTQAVRKLDAGFRLALTGTPVENRLAELWSIMNFLNPGYLGPRETFRNQYSLPIERYNDEHALQRLKKMVGPFILRRVKTDPRVIQDLPEKMETKVYCHLTEEQATLYEAVVQDALKQVEEKEGIERRGLILSMLMQLKQICNHPAQYLHLIGKEGGAAEALAGRSGKLERLAELLEEVLAEGDRVLIFTQFAEMGRLLASYLPQAVGATTQYLHGGTPAKTRDQLVQRFQEEKYAPPIFILSLKAGGTGLNLTRANHVFHFDRWWNPAVEDQATDRAFRIGQKQNVQVHKFVTTGTMEEMIDDLIESKKGLAQAVIGSGENWLTEISTQELRELVHLRR